jgi:predicted AlkP superfamily pyrophosphatase or phosphodiesterase
MKSIIFEEKLNRLSSEMSFGDCFILPNYNVLNVKNISSAIGTIYGINSLSSSNFPIDYLGDITCVEKVILLILDGFGYKRFLFHLNNIATTFREMVEKGVLEPFTTVFPSTTSTVLTSIFSGLSPAQHQIIGYQMFSREFGLVYYTLDMEPVYGYSDYVNLIKDYSDVIPWIPELKKYGVKASIATKSSIARSGLSKIIHKNTNLMPYWSSADMFMKSKKFLEQKDPTFLALYYDDIDTLAHKYGPYSEEVTFELTSMEYNLKKFFKSLSEKTKKKTLMILTADHGIAETHKTYYLKDNDDIMERLILPPVGDSRATFLYSKPDKQDTFPYVFKENYEDIELFPSNELIDKGIFGQTTKPEVLREKVGDFTALSTSQNILQYPYFENDRKREQLGSHGGMTIEEMIIPFLSLRLSKLD